jgi:hypothetical protein
MLANLVSIFAVLGIVGVAADKVLTPTQKEKLRWWDLVVQDWLKRVKTKPIAERMRSPWMLGLMFIVTGLFLIPNGISENSTNSVFTWRGILPLALISGVGYWWLGRSKNNNAFFKRLALLAITFYALASGFAWWVEWRTSVNEPDNLFFATFVGYFLKTVILKVFACYILVAVMPLIFAEWLLWMLRAVELVFDYCVKNNLIVFSTVCVVAGALAGIYKVFH